MWAKQRKLDSTVPVKQTDPAPEYLPRTPLGPRWKKSESRQQIDNATYRIPYRREPRAVDGDAEHGTEDDLDAMELANKRKYELQQATSLPKTWWASQTLATVKPGDVSIYRRLVTVPDFHREGKDYTPENRRAPGVRPLRQAMWSGGHRNASYGGHYPNVQTRVSGTAIFPQDFSKLPFTSGIKSQPTSVHANRASVSVDPLPRDVPSTATSSATLASPTTTSTNITSSSSFVVTMASSHSISEPAASISSPTMSPPGPLPSVPGDSARPSSADTWTNQNMLDADVPNARVAEPLSSLDSAATPESPEIATTLVQSVISQCTVFRCKKCVGEEYKTIEAIRGHLANGCSGKPQRIVVETLDFLPQPSYEDSPTVPFHPKLPSNHKDDPTATSEFPYNSADDAIEAGAPVEPTEPSTDAEDSNETPDILVPRGVWYFLSIYVLDETTVSSNDLFKTWVPYGLLALKLSKPAYRGVQRTPMIIGFKSLRRCKATMHYIEPRLAILGFMSIDPDERPMHYNNVYDFVFAPSFVEEVFANEMPSTLRTSHLAPGRAPLTSEPPPSENIIGKVARNKWLKIHRGSIHPWKEDFLEMNIWPPRAPGPSEWVPPYNATRRRWMDCLDFSVRWLEGFVATDMVARLNPTYTRLLTCMRAYEKPCSGRDPRDFMLIMLPTDGPYDQIIRYIAQAVRKEDDAHGKPRVRAPTRRTHESFGFSNSGGLGGWSLNSNSTSLAGHCARTRTITQLTVNAPSLHPPRSFALFLSPPLSTFVSQYCYFKPIWSDCILTVHFMGEE